MKEILIAFAFLSMVLSPCLVAMRSQLHRGADDFYDENREDDEEYNLPR
jgi:hypothetical protein